MVRGADHALAYHAQSNTTVAAEAKPSPEFTRAGGLVCYGNSIAKRDSARRQLACPTGATPSRPWSISNWSEFGSVEHGLPASSRYGTRQVMPVATSDSGAATALVCDHLVFCEVDRHHVEPRLR